MLHATDWPRPQHALSASSSGKWYTILAQKTAVCNAYRWNLGKNGINLQNRNSDKEVRNKHMDTKGESLAGVG